MFYALLSPIPTTPHLESEGKQVEREGAGEKGENKGERGGGGNLLFNDNKKVGRKSNMIPTSRH